MLGRPLCPQHRAKCDWAPVSRSGRRRAVVSRAGEQQQQDAAAEGPQQEEPGGASRAPSPGGGKAARRTNISERIEQLKRQNESLKQAIGMFLDQPQDVGAVTGRPTGSWDQGGTATLLDQLRKRPGSEDSEDEDGAGSSVGGGRPELQDSGGGGGGGGTIAAQQQQPQQTASLLEQQNAGPQLQASRSTSGAGRIGVAATEEEQEEEAPLPEGPVFSTSIAGPAWPPPSSSAPAAAASSSSSGGSSSSLAADAAGSNGGAAAAAASGSDTPAAPAPAAAAAAAPPAAAAEASAASTGSPQSKAAAVPAPSNGTGAAAAAAAAATATATAAVAPAAAAPVAPARALSIQERVEEMERQQQEEAAAAAAAAVNKGAKTAKPRAQARKPLVTSSTPMDVVFVSAEVAPWSKTGGLGDVMGALPQAMAARGHRVMVVTPRYTNGGKDASKFKDAKPLGKTVWVELAGSWHELRYHALRRAGVDWVFLQHMAFERPGTPYGDASGPFQDNLFRFALLCLGALEAPLNLPVKHSSSGEPLGEVYGQEVMFVANDWHAALLPLLLAARFRPFGVYNSARSCLAIHNLAHQGSYEAHRFHDLGLPGEWYGALEWENPSDAHRRKTINVLKAGIAASDLLVTVSQGYASEITGTPQDNRVDTLLAGRAARLRGIVNGIDTEEWDPSTDKHLAARYSAADLSGKADCKRALQRKMRLPLEPGVPLIGFIGRLDYQKGPDLLLDALPALANIECQVVILGTGAPDYEERVRAASHDYGWFCRGHVGFSVSLAHEIIAGCDILLMPSRFEPCGLNQLYAMRYGTVPVAHATGGLTDTISDYNPFAKGDGEGTGWTFSPAEVEPMIAAVSSAVSIYLERPERWRGLQLRGMAADCSWQAAAEQYEAVLGEAMADAVQYSARA